MNNAAHGNQCVVHHLQNMAKDLLLNYELRLKGVSIVLKEIEVYFYKKEVFEDNSVHRNDLQKNHGGYLYIHRWGTKKSDPYKGGQYPGIDYVVSTSDDEYYSYLIRSAVVDGEMVVGPHNVLEAIKKATHLNEKDIESSSVESVSNISRCQVLFSKRINLGKMVEEQYCNYRLRAVVCDGRFRSTKYPAKENMVLDYLCDELSQNKMEKDKAVKFTEEYLGYVPKIIRNY